MLGSTGPVVKVSILKMAAKNNTALPSKYIVSFPIKTNLLEYYFIIINYIFRFLFAISLLYR